MGAFARGFWWRRLVGLWGFFFFTVDVFGCGGVGVFGDMDMDYIFGCSFWVSISYDLGGLGCGG
jgi:hypothetical protein